MKDRIINDTLYNVHRGWYESIDDIKVRDLVRRNSIITGGCIPSLLWDEEVHDYDIYFRNFETVAAVAEYYVEQLKMINSRYAFTDNVRNIISVDYSTPEQVSFAIKNGGYATVKDVLCDTPFYAQSYEIRNFVELATYFRGKEYYQPLVISKNAITLTNKIQLVTKFYGSPSEITSRFDFEHTKCYWDNNGRVNYPQKSLLCITSKELNYVKGHKYPLSTLRRVCKFLKRGWKISAIDLIHIALDINALDLKNEKVAKEQFEGLYGDFFDNTLQVLKQDVKDGRSITHEYINRIIDNFRSV